MWFRSAYVLDRSGCKVYTREQGDRATGTRLALKLHRFSRGAAAGASSPCNELQVRPCQLFVFAISPSGQSELRNPASDTVSLERSFMAPAVTQHRPAFTPILKHKPGEPTDSPGYSSPSRSQAGAESSRQRAVQSSSSSSAVMLQPASPLTARSLENVPYYEPKTRATPKTVLSELPRHTDEEDRAAWSAAPRIRAKLTPAATPRRKAADVHGSHRAHVGAASPASATSHKLSFAVAPPTPQAASLVLPPPPSSPTRRTQPTSDPESVAVCVR